MRLLAPPPAEAGGFGMQGGVVYLYSVALDFSRG